MLLFITSSVNAQYFMRGNVKDNLGAPLVRAKILLHSSKTGTFADYDGTFGIISKLIRDSITVSLDGYEPKTLLIKTNEEQNVVLKISAETFAKNKPRLISFTKDAKAKERHNSFISAESYFKLVENEFVDATKFPNSGFSLNVNKASYSNVRRFINTNSRVPTDAVRVEEFVNYFNLYDDKPNGNDIFKINSSLTNCPWNNNNLLFVRLNAKKIPLDNLPAGNFVFLIDVSGSMDMPNRLPLIKEAFQLFTKNLRAIDKLSIVTYGGKVGTWLAPTNGDEKEKINNSIELLYAEGDTPGEWALEAAYKMAKATFIKNGNNRVIIATDADFNVGETSEKALQALVAKQRESGVFLTCLGVGSGNFKDSKLQTLAKTGNGNYAYLDNLHEAEKVLVHELTETLYAVADNAYINIQFNPEFVKSYRLIGFDNKKDAIEDASSFLDGGEIGSGSSTMAIFEIVPTSKTPTNVNTIGSINVKYKDVFDKPKEEREISYIIPYEGIDSTDVKLKFATALTVFGLKLKESPYLNKMSWEKIKQYAESVTDTNNVAQKQFLDLIYKAINIYEPFKKKKKNKNTKQ